MLSDHQSGRGIPHEATPACREPPMRRYLRCPGAICCPARRALRAVLQPHPVLRRADRRRVELLPRACGASAHQLAAADAPCAASLADAFRIASTVAIACATTLVLVRRREAAFHHAGAASGPSGRRRRARGARLALHGPALREGAQRRGRERKCHFSGRRIERDVGL